MELAPAVGSRSSCGAYPWPGFARRKPLHSPFAHHPPPPRARPNHEEVTAPLVAAAAFAVPASAFAWGGGHDHHRGDFRFRGFNALTKLSGTGTSFGGNSATAPGTGFTASLSTTWSSATSKTFFDKTVSCAPSTASITLTGKSAVSYTGRTSSWARNGTTKYVFMGRTSDGHAAFLKEDGTTVAVAVFAGTTGMHMGVLAAFHSGNCDHH